jgi:hypothetical protein
VTHDAHRDPVTDDQAPVPSDPAAAPAPGQAGAPAAPGASEPGGPAPTATGSGSRARMPDYRGEELDAERGPGLGCFWFQVGLLVFFFLLTPLTVKLEWPPMVSAILLFVTLGLLLFVGQTVIFLLRIVAAERRGRRRPLASATPTVGQIEESVDAGASAAAGPSSAADAAADSAAGASAASGPSSAVDAGPSAAVDAAVDEAAGAAPAALRDTGAGDRPDGDEGVRQ